jgi:hypothetical protein
MEIKSKFINANTFSYKACTAEKPQWNMRLLCQKSSVINIAQKAQLILVGCFILTAYKEFNLAFHCSGLEFRRKEPVAVN